MANKMPFLYRLASALQTLTGKGAGSDNVSAYTSISTWQEGRALQSNFNFRNAAREGYATNEVVYAVISDIAESAAEPTMRVYDGEDEELTQHPARRLIVQPNPVMTEFELWELTLIYLCLAGNAFFQKVRSRAGLPVQLWPITPGRMRPVPDRVKFIREWRYRLDDGSEIPIAPEDVVHFKYPNPLNPYMGLAPMAVAARAVDRDNQATDFVGAFFQNAAVPQGLLKLKRHVEEGEADRIRALWRSRYGGQRGWYDVAVLDADTEYQRLGLTQEEMGMPDLTDLTETRICMIFKWPAILAGTLAGLKRATYENIKTARRIAWEDTLSPIYQRFEARLNVDLASEFGFDVTARPFRWDFSLVKALQEDADARAERHRQAFVSGGITRNEYRTALNLDPDPRGDVYLMSLGMYELPQGEEPPSPVDEPKAYTAYPATTRMYELVRRAMAANEQRAANEQAGRIE
jgi:HK97 family phage portal protein